jgi:uncharacterized repeat protein (TIGR03803 family)
MKSGVILFAKQRSSRLPGVVLFLGTLVVGVTGGHAQTEIVLHTFGGGLDGAEPYGSLVIDAAGNLYGTTWENGTYGYGSIFKLAHTDNGDWQEALIHSFKGGDDSGFPWAGLILDPQGNLYGTTTDDSGLFGYGTVFKLTPAADGTWTESILYAFRGGTDGGVPYGRLVRDAAGNLFGTTFEGGNLAACIGSASGCGVVFELSPASSGRWKERVLYAFQSGTDGAFPEAGVVFDRKGNLYGTTAAGGGSPTCGTGCGTAFELSRSAGGSWRETVLYSFDLGPRGSDSNAPLVIDNAGNLYGTAHGGGSFGGSCDGGGCGVVFELSRNSGGGWAETVLHSFSGGSNDGSGPAEGGLTLDAHGNLYGTTAFGGVFDGGTVFKLSRAAGWKETLLHTFTPGSGGQYPFAAPLLDASSDLYGTTASGGEDNLGVVFKITK